MFKIKCPVCRNYDLVWLKKKKIGKIFIRCTYGCQTCGVTFKTFGLRGRISPIKTMLESGVTSGAAIATLIEIEANRKRRDK